MFPRLLNVSDKFYDNAREQISCTKRSKKKPYYFTYFEMVNEKSIIKHRQMNAYSFYQHLNASAR